MKPRHTFAWLALLVLAISPGRMLAQTTDLSAIGKEWIEFKNATTNLVDRFNAVGSSRAGDNDYNDKQLRLLLAWWSWDAHLQVLRRLLTNDADAFSNA